MAGEAANEFPTMSNASGPSAIAAKGATAIGSTPMDPAKLDQVQRPPTRPRGSSRATATSKIVLVCQATVDRT
jgi:hypothetical protein